MIINKGNTSPIWEGSNFTQSEIFNASYGVNGNQFDFSLKTLIGAQIVRDFYNQPLNVSASYRTAEHDKSKGRSGTGTHTRRLAIDLDPAGSESENVILDIHQQILNKGELYHLLRKSGINGVGLYDGFLHIDSRPDGGKQIDSDHGNWAFWDNRIITKKKSRP